MPHTSFKFRHIEKNGDMTFERDICKVSLDPLSIIPWKSGFFPKYEIGQKVFVIQRNDTNPKHEIYERFVESIECRIVAWDKTPNIITSGYFLDQPVGDDFTNKPILPSNIFVSKQAAEDEIRWTSLDLPYEVFRDALGCDKNGNRDDNLMETCELAPCCANISFIRDILIASMTDKGIMERNRLTVQQYLNDHEKPYAYDNLKKITESLGMKIDWLRKT